LALNPAWVGLKNLTFEGMGGQKKGGVGTKTGGDVTGRGEKNWTNNENFRARKKEKSPQKDYVCYPADRFREKTTEA